MKLTGVKWQLCAFITWTVMLVLLCVMVFVDFNQPTWMMLLILMPLGNIQGMATCVFMQKPGDLELNV
jgi:uncharacterized membrane protein